MTNRSILTLQIGNYSNRIGSHFWNTQESSFVYNSKDASTSEIVHDVLFREGVTSTHEITYTPRLILVDFKGSLGALPEFGHLYSSSTEDKEPEALWEGSTTVSHTVLESLNSNEWSNILKQYLHPKTNVLLKEYQHQNELHPFDLHSLGLEVWKKGMGEELEDRVRFFAEEVDYLQGFQILTDSDSGFGGISSELTTFLSDEYFKKGLISFSSFPSNYEDYTPIKNMTRLLNNTLTIHGLLSQCDLVTPLSLGSDYFSLPSQIQSFKYLGETSSSQILASILDTVTLPYRIKTLHEFKNVYSPLNYHNRKMAGILASFSENKIFESLTPGCSFGDEVIVQNLTLRGTQGISKFESYAKNNFPRTQSVIYSVSEPCKTFSKQTSLVTAWQSSSSSLEMLTNRVTKLNFHKLHRFIEAGLEIDHYKEVVNDLKNTLEQFKG